LRGFAILKRCSSEEIKQKLSFAAKIPMMSRLHLPYKDKELVFGDVVGCKINITHGFEKVKVKRAYNMGIKDYGHVISKEFNINYSPFFHHSCLIRALDFLTVKIGCDLRLSEVVIADASTIEGRNAFRLLLPLARRIILVTNKKKDLIDEADYAMQKYGTSVAVIEDPVKASDRADVLVIASSNPDHKYFVEIDRPTLYFNFLKLPSTKWWFDDVGISYKHGEEIETSFAQGYLDLFSKVPIWSSAEMNGFNIINLKKGKSNLLER
jgi:hypothetical protein